MSGDGGGVHRREVVPATLSARMDDRWQVSPRRADGSRGRRPDRNPFRITPTRLTLAIALIGSILFIAYAVTVRDPGQIPMLSAGSGILGVVFVALTIAGGVATYRAAVDGHPGRAFGLAILAGFAGLLASMSLAAAVILALVWQDRAA